MEVTMINYFSKSPIALQGSDRTLNSRPKILSGWVGQAQISMGLAGLARAGPARIDTPMYNGFIIQ